MAESPNPKNPHDIFSEGGYSPRSSVSNVENSWAKQYGAMVGAEPSTKSPHPETTSNPDHILAAQKRLHQDLLQQLLQLGAETDEIAQTAAQLALREEHDAALFAGLSQKLEIAALPEAKTEIPIEVRQLIEKALSLYLPSSAEKQQILEQLSYTLLENGEIKITAPAPIPIQTVASWETNYSHATHLVHSSEIRFFKKNDKYQLRECLFPASDGIAINVSISGKTQPITFQRGDKRFHVVGFRKSPESYGISITDIGIQSDPSDNAEWLRVIDIPDIVSKNGNEQPSSQLRLKTYVEGEDLQPLVIELPPIVQEPVKPPQPVEYRWTPTVPPHEKTKPPEITPRSAAEIYADLLSQPLMYEPRPRKLELLDKLKLELTDDGSNVRVSGVTLEHLSDAGVTSTVYAVKNGQGETLAIYKTEKEGKGSNAQELAQEFSLIFTHITGGAETYLLTFLGPQTDRKFFFIDQAGNDLALPTGLIQEYLPTDSERLFAILRETAEDTSADLETRKRALRNLFDISLQTIVHALEIPRKLSVVNRDFKEGNIRTPLTEDQILQAEHIDVALIDMSAIEYPRQFSKEIRAKNIANQAILVLAQLLPRLTKGTLEGGLISARIMKFNNQYSKLQMELFGHPDEKLIKVVQFLEICEKYEYNLYKVKAQRMVEELQGIGLV
jgi:hypothetical protein